MMPQLALYQGFKKKSNAIGPGTRQFITSLSVVSLCFALSKFFSSIATVVMARYLGKQVFGEANVVLLLAQVVCPLMLFGLHMSVMRFGAGKENPAPYVSTAFYVALCSTLILSCIVWLMRPLLDSWMDFHGHMVIWAIGLAVVMSAYMLFTHFYQMANLYRERGLIEVGLGFSLLPGLAVGLWLTGVSFQTILITYAVAYCLCLPPMIWRFRGMLSPRHLPAPNWQEMMKYGGFACFSGIGFILTFVVQPLQLNHYADASEVGIYRLYSASSISLATFATTIFYTVFFPKVAASGNRRHIWHMLTKAWVRAAVPLFCLYALVFSLSVSLSGHDYPLSLAYVVLFSLASVLITIQTTYGQMVAAQGVKGMRWILIIGISSGVLNILLSWWLIPSLGIKGAVLALIINFALSLFAVISLRNALFALQEPAAAQTPTT